MGFRSIATTAVSAVGLYMIVLWTLESTGIWNWIFFAIPRIIVGTILFGAAAVIVLAIPFYTYFAIDHYLSGSNKIYRRYLIEY